MAADRHGSTAAPTDPTRERIQRIAQLRDQFTNTNGQPPTHVGIPENWLGDMVPGDHLCGMEAFALDDTIHLQPVVLRVVGR